MRKTRLDFNQALKDVLGSEHVYFSPPESVKLVYPCIIYERDPYKTENADNKIYYLYTKYTVTYIDRDPDAGEFKQNERYEDEEETNMIQKILFTFPLCSHDRSFVSDNLNHNVFTIYF